MLHVQKFTVNMIQENCYILSDETKEAVIIDDGAYYHEERLAIEEYIQSEKLIPVHLIDTHAHFDHVLGNKAIYDKYHLKAEFNSKDATLYDNATLQAQNLLGEKFEVEKAPIGEFIKEHDLIKFGNHSLNAIETPGHSPGGLCFYCEEEKVLFSGDTLFKFSIGRSDLEGGSSSDLISSIKNKLFTLPEDTTVLPGHGPSTTIKDEKEGNLYFR